MNDIDKLSAPNQKMVYLKPLPFGKQAAVNNIDYGAFFMLIFITL